MRRIKQSVFTEMKKRRQGLGHGESHICFAQELELYVNYELGLYVNYVCKLWTGFVLRTEKSTFAVKRAAAV